jgi:hypothetical protein
VQNGEAATLGERVVPVGREGNRSGQRCGEARRGCSPFIGADGVLGRGGRAVNTGVNGFNAIEEGPA